jgi:hypothetical protein
MQHFLHGTQVDGEGVGGEVKVSRDERETEVRLPPPPPPTQPTMQHFLHGIAVAQLDDESVGGEVKASRDERKTQSGNTPPPSTPSYRACPPHAVPVARRNCCRVSTDTLSPRRIRPVSFFNTNALIPRRKLEKKLLSLLLLWFLIVTLALHFLHSRVDRRISTNQAGGLFSNEFVSGTAELDSIPIDGWLGLGKTIAFVFVADANADADCKRKRKRKRN